MKPLLIISSPVDTYSGYGARSRDLIKAIIATDKYNVQLLSQRWGNTRFGYLADHNELDLLGRIIPNVTTAPEIWMQITVPNEFQPIGKFNIGVTAGMETTLVAPQWIEGCNRMNLVLTSSNHSKNVFESTAYDVQNKNTGQKQQLKLTTPVKVIFEGVDTSKYFITKSQLTALDDIKESFCFLQVGHWMQGDLGHDRKNIGYTVKTFLETFKNKPNPPALILKTATVNSSLLDQERILNKIDAIRKTVKGKLPNIYVLHGEMSDEEINWLYNHPKVKAMVSHTKGEGFGRPLLEFTTTGKPIITSGWSGQVDFLHKDKCIFIGGTLEPVHKSAAVKDMILEQAQWFKPDDIEVGRAYKELFKKYNSFTVNGKKQKRNTLDNFTLEHMNKLVKETLNSEIPDIPVQVPLDLPELKV